MGVTKKKTNSTDFTSDLTNQYSKDMTNSYSNLMNYGDFTASQNLINTKKKKTAAEMALENYGSFNWNRQGDYDSLFDKYLNRGDFSYDVNGDALYQQYKDQYTTQGKLASMDVMGQAAAMNGGYGSSYAQSVGQQAYQGYLQKLNEVVPELYQLAYNKYTQEGRDMENQLSLLGSDRSAQYGEWSDGYNRLAADRDYYGNDYYNLHNQEYGMYVDKYGRLVDSYNTSSDAYNTSWNQDYTLHKDDIENNQWQQEFDEAVRQFNLENGYAGVGAGGGGNEGDTTTVDNGGVGDADIKAMQKALGFTGSEVDGKWGPKTQKKAQEMWGTTSVSEALKKYNEDLKKPTAGEVYDFAIKHLETEGADSSVTSRLMTLSEWNQRRDQGNNGAYGDTYEDYVDLFLELNKKKTTGTTTTTGTTKATSKTKATTTKS